MAKTVCFTGHRDIDVSSASILPAILKSTMRKMVARGARRFLAGGAMGFDTLAALCVLELKAEFPDIRLELILPCRNQMQRWDARSTTAFSFLSTEGSPIVPRGESLTRVSLPSERTTGTRVVEVLERFT